MASTTAESKSPRRPLPMAAATVQDLTRLLSESREPVFLTGAGMSTESGIPDFRSQTGLYNSGISEEIFDINAFRRDPEAFFAFARRFLRQTLEAEPNPGHRAIADLETLCGRPVQVITQNIDDLHQRAGSTRVYPIHGTLETCTCQRCGEKIAAVALQPIIEAGTVPRHQACGGVWKHDIVFFGEFLPVAELTASERAVAAADLLIVAGTSLRVYPAAALPASRRPECRLLIINRTPTELDSQADLVCRGSIGDLLSNAVATLADTGR
jgi:NAD-dependent deacetylase